MNHPVPASVRSIDTPKGDGAYTTMALALPDGLTLDEWGQAGVPFLEGAESSRWWIGDWLVYAINHFELDDNGNPDPQGGARVRQKITEVCRLDWQSIKACRWVAKAFEPSRRRAALSWTHHLTVAKMPPTTADRWLAQAEEHGWSVATLRQEIQAEAVDVEGRTAAPTPRLRFKRPLTIDDAGKRSRVLAGFRRVLTDEGLNADLLEVA